LKGRNEKTHKKTSGAIQTRTITTKLHGGLIIIRDERGREKANNNLKGKRENKFDKRLN